MELTRSGRRTTTFFTRTKRLWANWGPGIVTGASDDDPSGIAMYSQAGALSYEVAETFSWRAGLDRHFRQAPGST